jgi:hypothetical protein
LSQVIPGDVVGPSHWTYMAKVMADVLNKAFEKSCLAKADVPAGVLADAVRFSQLVLVGPGPNLLTVENQTHFMALEAMERQLGHFPNLQDVNHMLFGCALILIIGGNGIVDEIKNPAVFPIVASMTRFFSELSKMGEEERSAQLASGDDLDE